MNSAYRAQGVAILLLALVLLSGCQAFGKWGGKKPAAKAPSSLSQMLSGKGVASKSLDQSQKSDVEMAMARSLEKQGKSDEALKVYLHVIEKDESRADAYHRVALIYDRQGACDKSREYYLAALKSLPENAELNSDFGYSCYLQERWDEAEKHLRRAVELKPTLARAHNNLGMLLARKGREEEALAEFGRAGCTKAEAHANLGLALMLAQRWDSADGHLSQAIKAQPRWQAPRETYAALQAVRAPAALAAQSAPGPPDAAPPDAAPMPLDSTSRPAAGRVGGSVEYTAWRSPALVPLPPITGGAMR